MQWVTERRHEMSIASRRQYAADFAHDLPGIANVFQHRITLRALKNVRWERQVFRVGGDIDSRRPDQIEVDIAWDKTAGSADVEVSSAQRGFVNERSRRLNQPKQAIAPAA
jgi:hypothetical protein